MAEHGRLYDNFSASPSHTHGGSYFDAGFGLQEVHDAHGKLYDLFGVPRDSDAHGERFDDFGWHDMPVLHGQQFDSDFRAPTAGSGEHGSTWYDVFRGGRTQARYMFDGRDYEGTVVECTREYAKVRAHDGQTHEVGLSQFLSFRTPNEEQAAPSIPESSADAPSAHSPEAHGASHGDRTAVPTDMPPVIQEAPQGQHTEPRSGVPAGVMDTFLHVKSLVARYEADDVAKAVDSTETAVQGSPGGKTVGHRKNCPLGGSAPCGADVKGKCTKCNKSVQDHEAVGKVDSDGTGITHRQHKTTDHHSSQRKPSTCPHCGGALEELDHQTEQGQPDRTHKCLGASLDVLKTLVTA